MKQPKKGGARSGAGRPPQHKDLKAVTLKMPCSLIEAIKELAESKGVSQAQVIRIACFMWLKRENESPLDRIKEAHQSSTTEQDIYKYKF